MPIWCVKISGTTKLCRMHGNKLHMCRNVFLRQKSLIWTKWALLKQSLAAMVISYVQNTTHIPVSSRYVENEETVSMSYNSQHVLKIDFSLNGSQDRTWSVWMLIYVKKTLTQMLSSLIVHRKGGTGGWTVTIRKLPPSVYSVTHDCWRGMPVSHFDEGHVKKSPYALKELNMKEFYSC